MLFRIQGIAIVFATATALCVAAEDPKPACTAETQGEMWPESANRDPKLFKKLARCGQLEICTRRHRHYLWESPTVRFDQLRGGVGSASPAGCEVPLEAPQGENALPPSARE
jgi:hypothetical protein